MLMQLAETLQVFSQQTGLYTVACISSSCGFALMPPLTSRAVTVVSGATGSSVVVVVVVEVVEVVVVVEVVGSVRSTTGVVSWWMGVPRVPVAVKTTRRPKNY